MRIQDSPVWQDPVVQETISCLGDLGELSAGEGDIRDHAIVRVMQETDSLEPLALSWLLADSAWIRSNLPAPVMAFKEMVDLDRVKGEGVQHIFDARDVPALKYVLAAYASECTGEALRAEIENYGRESLAGNANDGAPNFTALAKGMTETGMWKHVSPKLLDKFYESVHNVRSLMTDNAASQALGAAASGLRTEIAAVTAREIADNTPPRIDPSSMYEVCKQVAKTKYKVRPQ